MPTSPPSSPRTRWVRTLGRVAALLVVWLVVAAPVAALTFANSSRETVLAGHEATVNPTWDGWAQVDLGPFLPRLRYPTGTPVGALIELGRTPLTSYEQLGERYAFIASQPDGQIEKVSTLVREMAVDAVAIGTAAGLLAPLVWYTLGAKRRRDLLRTRPRLVETTAAITIIALVAVGLVWRPWDQPPTRLPQATWLPLADVVPEGLKVPKEALPLEVEGGLLSQGTRRLVESAVKSFRVSSTFYGTAAEEIGTRADAFHEPAEDETVVALVSDRHDNIGMDPVARAVADVAQATVLFDAGDDTSTGSSWEAFSLESLDTAFADFEDRYLVPGNHDHGDFIPGQAADLGFTVLDTTAVEGPAGIRLLGVADPRSSGLGNWRDETGLSFSEVTTRLADTACADDEDGNRISTMLVHDANLGREALARGCVDLVLGGHLHVVVGPTAVEGSNGQVGYSFTTGTTGGSAYAIAIGTKPRRDATMSLVTYREGRPVGVQTVSLSPLGTWTVGEYELFEDVAPTADADGPIVPTEGPSADPADEPTDEPAVDPTDEPTEEP